MIAEAIDTVFTLGWALIVWIVLLAIVAGLILYAVTVTVWATVRGVWRSRASLCARLAAVQEQHAPQEPRDAHAASQPRRVPSWAHTQPIDCEEAA